MEEKKKKKQEEKTDVTQKKVKVSLWHNVTWYMGLKMFVFWVHKLCWHHQKSVVFYWADDTFVSISLDQTTF